MAAAPVKSPLHNFPLTFLQWGSKKDPQRCPRRPPYDSSPLSPPHQPPSDAPEPSHSKPVGSRSSRNRRHHNHNHQSQDDDVEERETGKKQEANTGEEGWNLRPRRGVTLKSGNNNNGNVTAGVAEGENMVKISRLRGGESGGGGGEKKKFWIALSKDEIEEDVYSMTGSKPSRRPRKRPKNVQKQLDNVFPGLWLVGVSPESYRGFEVPPKSI